MDSKTLIIIYSVLLVILLGLSFFFSSSDMAYGSIDLYRFEKEIEAGNNKKSIKYAYKLAKNYDKTISTILLLNDTVNAALDALSTLLGVNLCLLIVGSTTPGVNDLAENWGFIASMICLVVKIIFGEIIAKSMGKIFNFKFSTSYSYVIRIFDYICIPITFLVSGFGKIVTYPITRNVKDVVIVEDDLHEMVDDIKDQGGVDEDSAELLHDTIDYTKTEAYEIMTPRVEIFAIDIEDSLEEIFEKEELFKHTRVPVYEETIDNVIGYINTKQLMILKVNDKPINIKELLIEPLRFPRSTEINDILKVFKKEKQHFALIIDEYGGLEGILTMEDILEEIVGEIFDENDEIEEEYSETKDGDYIVDGKYNLQDFCELFNIDYDELDTEYVTIGGYCIELLDDKFAKIGDEIEFKNLLLKVIALDENDMIEKLKVTIKSEEDD